MHTDISDGAKIGLTIILMVMIVGVVSQINYMTQDYIKGEQYKTDRSMAVADYQTIIAVCDNGEPLTGATLYSLLVEYGSSLSGVCVESNVYTTHMQNFMSNRFPQGVNISVINGQYFFPVATTQTNTPVISDLADYIYKYGLNYKYDVVRSDTHSMSSMQPTELFIDISSCTKIGGGS